MLRETSYGTTPLGGGNGTLEGVGQCTVELETFGCGVVFKVDPSGNETVLYRFVGGPTDGAYPAAGLIMDAEGNLYGTTRSGGGPVFMDQQQTGHGTIFKIDPSGNETVLYIFCSSAANPCRDGASPLASLVRDAEGNLVRHHLCGRSFEFRNGVQAEYERR